MAEEDNEPLGDIEQDENVDDKENESEDKEEEILDETALSSFMADNRLNANKDKWSQRLHKYFHEELKITFAREFVDHLPSAVMQPAGKKFVNMGLATRKYLIKMGGKIGKKVINGEWKGQHQVDWINKYGGNNYISYTFAPSKMITHPKMMKSTTDRPLVLWKAPKEENKDKDKDKKKRKKLKKQTDKVQIFGNDKVYVDKKLGLNKKFGCIINVEEFPETEKTKESFAIGIGVRFYSQHKESNKNVLRQTVYMNDRCQIGKCTANVQDLNSSSFIQQLTLSNHQMLENGSQVMVEIDNKEFEPTVKFSHLRNNILLKSNETTVILEGFKQKNPSIAKVFCQQNYGEGIYTLELPQSEKERIFNQRLLKKKQSQNKSKISPKKILKKKGKRSPSSNSSDKTPPSQTKMMSHISHQSSIANFDKFRRSSLNTLLKKHRASV